MKLVFVSKYFAEEVMEDLGFRLPQSSYEIINNPTLCFATSEQIIIELPTCVIPQGISPNNDGINERFTMIAVRGMIEKVEITIYSRWGRQLYRGPVWDGRYKGQLQLPGVYVYTARAQTFDGQEIQLKGTVTLLR